jgi:hypothetical protein
MANVREPHKVTVHELFVFKLATNSAIEASDASRIGSDLVKRTGKPVVILGPGEDLTSLGEEELLGCGWVRSDRVHEASARIIDLEAEIARLSALVVSYPGA